MRSSNKKHPGKWLFLPGFFLLGLFCASPALSASCYLVTGAPIPEANGEYFESGIYGGDPMYVKGDWTLRVYVPPGGGVSMGCSWQIVKNEIEYYQTLSVMEECTIPSPDFPWFDDKDDAVPIKVYPCGQMIPTLNPWGLALFIAFLLASSWFLFRKKREDTV